jgi:hypothetical protein
MKRGDEECDSKLRRNVTGDPTLTDDPRKTAHLLVSDPITRKIAN